MGNQVIQWLKKLNKLSRLFFYKKKNLSYLKNSANFVTIQLFTGKNNMQHHAQAIDLSNIPTMEEVLNGRLHFGQRSFSSENRILQDDITEKSSYNKRGKRYKELRVSPQQVPLQTFQWSSQDLSQDFRSNEENILKFENGKYFKYLYFHFI
jgi:hypothetical protein